jgi:hypothetical protein
MAYFAYVNYSFICFDVFIWIQQKAPISIGGGMNAVFPNSADVQMPAESR